MADTVAKKSLIQRFRDRRPEDYNATWLGFTALAAIAVVDRGSGGREISPHRGYRLHRGVRPSRVAATRQHRHRRRHRSRQCPQRASSPAIMSRSGLTVRDDVELGKDTKAAIRLQTFLGGRYLALHARRRRFTTGQDDHAGPHRSSLRPAGPAGRRVRHIRVNWTPTSWRSRLPILGKQVNGLPAIVPQAMDNMHKLSSVVADRRTQLGTLLKSTQRVADILHSQQTRVGDLINQGQNLLGEFVARQVTFRAMLAALTGLTNNLDKIVVDDRPMLDDMFKNVRGAQRHARAARRMVSNLLQIAPVALRGLTNATGYGPTLEFFLPNGLAIDSWMCAISGRATQFNMIEYYKDCK